MLEVITPGTELYGTLAEFKAFYGITDAGQDAYWQGMLTSASEVVSEYCGRPLMNEAVKETVRFENGSRSIVLERWPVTVAPVITYGPTDTAVASTLYEVDVRAGLIRGVTSQGHYSWFDPGVWKITYSGGFVTIPLAVKQATWVLMKEQEALTKIVAGIKSRRIEGMVATSYFDPDKLIDDMPPAAKLFLRRYKER